MTHVGITTPYNIWPIFYRPYNMGHMVWAITIVYLIRKKLLTFLNLSFVTFQSKIRLFTLLKQTGSQIKFVSIYWSSHLSTRLLGRSLRRISWLMHVLGNYDLFRFRLIFGIFSALNKWLGRNKYKCNTHSRTGEGLRLAFCITLACMQELNFYQIKTLGATVSPYQSQMTLKNVRLGIWIK